MISGIVTDAVEGDPDVTVAVPWLAPSSRIVTVPLGLAADTELEEVTLAFTSRELPAVGVSVAGTTTVVVGLLPTVMVTGAETDAA